MRSRGMWTAAIFALIGATAWGQQAASRVGGLGGHAGYSAARVPATADSFVSLPGSIVPGPGQAVFSAGQQIDGPGEAVFPAPGVLTPFFHAGRQSSQASEGDGDSSAYSGLNGGGSAVPYLFGSGYWMSGYGPDPAGAMTASPKHTATATATASAASADGMRMPNEAPTAEDTYRPRYPAAESTADAVLRPEPVLTVVMKDGTRKQMRNYALTPDTLMDLDAASSGREIDIPLTEVNIAATQKAA